MCIDWQEMILYDFIVRSFLNINKKINFINSILQDTVKIRLLFLDNKFL